MTSVLSGSSPCIHTRPLNVLLQKLELSGGRAIFETFPFNNVWRNKKNEYWRRVDMKSFSQSISLSRKTMAARCDLIARDLHGWYKEIQNRSCFPVGCVKTYEIKGPTYCFCTVSVTNSRLRYTSSLKHKLFLNWRLLALICVSCDFWRICFY